MGWGRNAATDGITAPRKRYGLYSILLALLAPMLVISAGAYMTNMPEGVPEGTQDFANGMTLVAYGIVAPLLHIIGIGFGIAGLRSVNAGKVSSVIGILLNIALIAMGVFLGWIAASGIGAFT